MKRFLSLLLFILSLTTQSFAEQITVEVYQFTSIFQEYTKTDQFERIEATRDLGTLSFIVTNAQMEILIARFPQGHFFANSASDYASSYGQLAGRKLRVVSQAEHDEAVAAWEIFNPLSVNTAGTVGKHLAPECSLSSVFCAAQKAPSGVLGHAVGVAGSAITRRIGDALTLQGGGGARAAVAGEDAAGHAVDAAAGADADGHAAAAAAVDAEREQQLRAARAERDAEIEAGLRARGILKEAPRRLPKYMFAAHFAGAAWGGLKSAKTIIWVCGTAYTAYCIYNQFTSPGADGSSP